MSRKSPLNDPAEARAYAERQVRAWAAENLTDGAAVFASVSLGDIVDAALAEWAQRMADPERRMPNGEPPNKRKEIDYAIDHAIAARFLA